MKKTKVKSKKKKLLNWGDVLLKHAGMLKCPPGEDAVSLIHKYRNE